MEQTMIKVTINGETREYPKMTPYSEIIRDYEGKTEYPVILVTENGKLRELHKKLQHDCTLGFITAKDSAGRKTYRRSAIFILLKAIFDVAGKENVDHVVIHYSIGNALYFTMKGSATLDQELLDQVKVRMRELVDQKIPIYKRSVSTDDAKGAEAAVEYLMNLGHKNIGILGGRMEKSHAAYTRCVGCADAFQKHKMAFDRKKQYEPALFSMEEGYRAMNALLDRMPDLTAVFAMADVLAMGAIRAICDRGLKVPEDISVIGFDGIELGNYLSPRLTTVRQARERIADRSLEILLSDIAGERPAVHELLPFDIVEGESAAECMQKG